MFVERNIMIYFGLGWTRFGCRRPFGTIWALGPMGCRAKTLGPYNQDKPEAWNKAGEARARPGQGNHNIIYMCIYIYIYTSAGTRFAVHGTSACARRV